MSNQLTRDNLISIIKAGLNATGHTAQSASRQAGLDKDTLRDLFRGKTHILRADKMQALSRVLNLGIDNIPDKNILPVRGIIKSGSIVVMFNEADIAQIALPPTIAAEGLKHAYKFVDDSNAPMAYRNWYYAVGERINGGCEDYSDVPYIVKLPDGRIMVKRLRRGHSPGLYNLLGIGDLIEDAEIEWCEPVLAILPRAESI